MLNFIGYYPVGGCDSLFDLGNHTYRRGTGFSRSKKDIHELIQRTTE